MLYGGMRTLKVLFLIYILAKCFVEETDITLFLKYKFISVGYHLYAN